MYWESPVFAEGDGLTSVLDWKNLFLPLYDCQFDNLCKLWHAPLEWQNVIYCLFKLFSGMLSKNIAEQGC